MSNSVISLNGRDVPIKSVTVYTDRAEVVRTFIVTLKSGFNEVSINNLAGSINRDSIRVDGTGPAAIHEVRFETKPVKPEDLDTPRIRELVVQQKNLQKVVEDAQNLKSVFENQIEALQKTALTLGQNLVKGQEGNLVTFNEDSVTSLNSFFSFQQDQILEKQSKIRVQKQVVEDNENEISRLQNEINELRSTFYENNIVTVQLENNYDEDSTVELELNYHVFNARWSPSYDIRVRKEDETYKLKLAYYGNIQQQTGEDWNDVDITLSTATPSLGRDLPTLGTTNVQFYTPPPPQPEVRYAAFGGARDSYALESAVPCGAPVMRSLKMNVHQENSLSAVFVIPIKKTVPSDHAEHKVTITNEELEAILSYHVVPKVNTDVFLVADVINDSSYPLIAGSASVFLNNSMVANINLKTTFPGEKFQCSLGVDKSIKVTYKPPHKYQTQSGVMSKIYSAGNEQRVVVKNTKLTESILICVHEPIPKSTDEKIKVRLLSPEIKEALATVPEKPKLTAPDVGAVLDDLHNLLWTSLIASSEEKELTIKWLVEYPPNKTLEYVEVN